MARTLAEILEGLWMVLKVSISLFAALLLLILLFPSLGSPWLEIWLPAGLVSCESSSDAELDFLSTATPAIPSSSGAFSACSNVQARVRQIPRQIVLQGAAQHLWAKEAVSRGLPVVLTNTVVQEWACHNWTMPLLEARLTQLGYGMNPTVVPAEAMAGTGERRVMQGRKELEVLMKSSRSPVFKFWNRQKPMLEEGVVPEALLSATNEDWIALPHLLSLISSASSSPPPEPPMHSPPATSISAEGHSCIDIDDKEGHCPEPAQPSHSGASPHAAAAPHLYYYFSDGIAALREAGQDCLPLHDFSPTGNIGDCDVNVWLGQAGVTAHSHYDGFDNFFTQLSGKKRIRLAPPAAKQVLHPFPYIHPAARQAQTDCLAPAGARAVGGEGLTPAVGAGGERGRGTGEGRSEQQALLEVWETVLGEGEVLYIPAYWWHRVTAMDAAISLNAWCPSVASVTNSGVESFPFPFEEDWGRPRRAREVKNFFQAVLMRLHVEPSLRQNDPDGQYRYQAAKQAVEALLSERYWWRQHENNSTSREPFSFSRPISCVSLEATVGRDREHGGQSEPSTAATLPELCGEAEAETETETEGEGKGKADDYEDRIAKLVAALQAPGLVPEARDALVGNWLEMFSAWAVGAGEVQRFLQCCF